MLDYRLSRKLENPNPEMFAMVTGHVNGTPTVRIVTTLKEGYLTYFKRMFTNISFVHVRQIEKWRGRCKVIADVPLDSLTAILVYSSINNFKVVYKPVRKEQ